MGLFQGYSGWCTALGSRLRLLGAWQVAAQVPKFAVGRHAFSRVGVFQPLGGPTHMQNGKARSEPLQSAAPAQGLCC